MVDKQIRQREYAPPVGWPDSIAPVLQRVYAARGVTDPDQLERRLVKLLHPELMGSMAEAAEAVGRAILADQVIMVSGDYDCDGATGSAVAVRGLRLLGAKNVHFIVPDRFKHGYGLSPGLVDAMDPVPQMIVTVDSGVASVEGVAYAKSKGIPVVVTDHHLPGEILPEALAIINPNLKGDEFPSKMLAGVGVVFYLLLAIRMQFRSMGLFDDRDEPDLSSLLDLVAIGTIADLVPLDQNNRILVEAGLKRIRAGHANAGIKALITASGRQAATLCAQDIGFSVAPRLNAAGRLENMRLGVETLLCDDEVEAAEKVKVLDAINTERKELQADMIAEAESLLLTTVAGDATGVVVYDPSWHSGVIGLVASRLKENLYRPVFALAPGKEGSGEVKGSGRSIEGFHLRDALARIDVQNPGLMVAFGGHAMAAGLTIRASDVQRFSEAFDADARAQLTEDQLQSVVLTDGPLAFDELTKDTASLLRQGGPWGQGFPEPLFDNVFEVMDWRVIGNGHLKLRLGYPQTPLIFEAIEFSGYTGQPPARMVRVAYSLDLNVWQDTVSLQLAIKRLLPA